jgi:hypothetical protein
LREQATQQAIRQRPAKGPLDMTARDVDQVSVIDLHGTGRHARVTREATVEVMNGFRVRRAALLQHRPDEVDPAARRIVLVAEQHVGRARRRAESIVDAGRQDAVGLGNLRLRKLILGERGLHGCAGAASGICGRDRSILA